MLQVSVIPVLLHTLCFCCTLQALQLSVLISVDKRYSPVYSLVQLCVTDIQGVFVQCQSRTLTC